MGAVDLPEITPERIAAARAAGAAHVTHTPVIESAALSARTHGTIVLKAENLQRTGSFKVRGALAKLAELGEAAGAGVTAGSAGNHAQALAFAASVHGVPCEIFVPNGASISKTEATRALRRHGHDGRRAPSTTPWPRPSSSPSRAACTSARPFDDPAIIAGQAGVGLEIAEDVPDLRRVIVPVGGGGLASGVAIALKRHDPTIRVIGVQVAACAPYANQPPARGARSPRWPTASP